MMVILGFRLLDMILQEESLKFNLITLHLVSADFLHPFSATAH